MSKLEKITGEVHKDTCFVLSILQTSLKKKELILQTPRKKFVLLSYQV